MMQQHQYVEMMERVQSVRKKMGRLKGMGQPRELAQVNKLFDNFFVIFITKR